MKSFGKQKNLSQTFIKKKGKITLREDNKMRILKADKGITTVAMNAVEYHKKVHELFDDKNAYALFKKDPTRSTEESLLARLRELKKMD